MRKIDSSEAAFRELMRRVKIAHERRQKLGRAHPPPVKIQALLWACRDMVVLSGCNHPDEMLGQCAPDLVKEMWGLWGVYFPKDT